MATTHPGLTSVAWAQWIIRHRNAVFIDTETTGLDGSAEIVDIAIVGVDGKVLLDTLVKPARHIPSFVSRIHGIYDDDVANAPSWCDEYEMAYPLLSGRPVVVFNVGFDRRIIQQCCAISRLRQIDGAPGWHCAMKMYATYIGERGHGYRSQKLENAARSFNITPGGHRALGDAEACRQVVHRMAQG
jgi:DNA polymerase III subunit epsilon